MKIKLHITKESKTLLENRYDVSDANSFGEACADAFSRLRSKELRETPNVGAMMDRLGLNVLEILDGATISITKA
jgi:hypothetical protein